MGAHHGETDRGPNLAGLEFRFRLLELHVQVGCELVTHLVFHAAQNKSGGGDITAQDVQTGTQEIWSALWGTYEDQEGRAHKVGGAMTKDPQRRVGVGRRGNVGRHAEPPACQPRAA